MTAAEDKPERGRTELYILTSFYLAENDVDYTANHHQGIEDIPGVPDITLDMAACTAGRRAEEAGERRRRWGCREEVRGLG